MSTRTLGASNDRAAVAPTRAATKPLGRAGGKASTLSSRARQRPACAHRLCNDSSDTPDTPLASLVQSAKLNGHNPWAYLKDVLTRLPMHLNNRIKELLPHRWQPLG